MLSFYGHVETASAIAFNIPVLSFFHFFKFGWEMVFVIYKRFQETRRRILVGQALDLIVETVWLFIQQGGRCRKTIEFPNFFRPQLRGFAMLAFETQDPRTRLEPDMDAASSRHKEGNSCTITFTYETSPELKMASAGTFYSTTAIFKMAIRGS